MKIEVKIKTGSKKSGVVKGGGFYIVSTIARPKDNEANEEAQALLAEYFGKSKSEVSLVRGFKSKQKVFEIT